MFSVSNGQADKGSPFLRIKHHAFILLCFSTLLFACSNPAPLPTPTASPCPTMTPQSFDFPDLTDLLTDRQLPSLASSADISKIPHPDFADLPEPDAFISVRYASGSDFSGRLSIFAYAQAEELDTAWPLVLARIYTPREIDGPGELTAVNHSDLAFIRCSMLVHIKLVSADHDELLTFAENLDADLKNAVCPVD